MKTAVLVLTILFWLSLVAAVRWVTVNAVVYDIVVGSLGEREARLGYTLLFGALALTSGLLVAFHRLTNIFVDRDAYWTGSEVFYAVALFMALFFGLYGFLGWYFSG